MKKSFKFYLCLIPLVYLGFLLEAQTSSPVPTPAPASVPAPSSFVDSLGLKFVPVPGTTTLFCTSMTRVRDYAKFVEVNHREIVRPDFAQTQDDPVVMVSWEDAMAFCSWLTGKEHASKVLPPAWKYRLPTDAEWNAAVGLPSENAKPLDLTGSSSEQPVYPWGTDWPPPKGAGNYNPSLGVDSYRYTSPVKSFAPNANGLYDMGGNAWEWCMDSFNDSVDFRVLRGASWNMRNPGDLLSSARVGNHPDIHLDTYSFRCVIECPEEPAPTPVSVPTVAPSPSASNSASASH